MSERRTVTYDHRTGQVRETRTTIRDGQTVPERVEGLLANAEEQLPGRPRHRAVAVSCDQCGRIEEIDADQPALPDGWSTGPHGELCPGCQ